MNRSLVLPMVVAFGLVTVACGKPDVSTTSNVLYQEDTDGTRYTMNVYVPATGDGPWPVAVMIHGAGGFTLDHWARDVARQGVVAFVAYWSDTGLPPSAEEFRTAVTATTERLACAVRFARAEAERYGGDPSNVTLLGHSAGANYASVIAFADPEVPEGCLVDEGSVLPDNLVLFDGDWLIMGLPEGWDRLLREDRGVMDTITPWSHLEESDRMPVHILDSDAPGLYRDAEGADRWLALRDPTGVFYQELQRGGAFDDGKVSEHEAQRLLYDRFQSLGYEVSFHPLPDSGHEHLSDAALKVMADAILQDT